MAYAAITTTAGTDIATYRDLAPLLGDEPPDGLILETATSTADGLHVISVWETKAKHDRFIVERLLPAFQRAGVVPGPVQAREVEVESLLLGPALAAVQA